MNNCFQKMHWELIDCEQDIKSICVNSVFCDFQAFEKHVIIISEAGITSLIVFVTELDRLVVECTKRIRSNIVSRKIVTNDHGIFMLSTENELFILNVKIENSVLALNFFNVAQWLSNESLLTWRKVKHLNCCLDVIASDGKVTAINFHNEEVSAVLWECSEIEADLTDFTSKVIHSSKDQGNIYLKRLQNSKLSDRISKNFFCNPIKPYDEIYFLVEDNAVYILKRIHTLIQVYKTYFTVTKLKSLVDVISFPDSCLILLVLKNGTIIVLNFPDDSKSFGVKYIKLPTKIASIAAYENKNIFLIWSDGNTVNSAKLDNENKVCQVSGMGKLWGIVRVFNINGSIIGLNRNCCFYQIIGIDSKAEKCMEISLKDTLHGIQCEAGVVAKLINQVERKEEFSAVLGIVDILDVGNKIKVFLKNSSLELRNDTSYTFKKQLWKIIWEVFSSNCIEGGATIIEDDLLPGGVITISYHRKSPPDRVSLICNTMNHLKMIDLDVSNINRENSEEALELKHALFHDNPFISHNRKKHIQK